MRLRHFLYYLGYILAVVGLSAVIILAFHSKIGETKPATKPKTVVAQNHSTAQTKTQPSQQNNSSNSSQTHSGGQSSSPAPATAPASASSSRLVNTGPGNSLVLFAVISLVATLAYRQHLLKKV